VTNIFNITDKVGAATTGLYRKKKKKKIQEKKIKNYLYLNEKKKIKN
jgi:hypothetical protein